MSDFTHLHCHTEYSFLDGAIRIQDLCAKAVDFGFSAVSISDHGSMFGALDFYLKARSFGLKPIIGSEVYVAPRSMEDKDQQRFHLLLLAQDLEGYHNLVRLVSTGYTRGFYYKPRVDKAALRQWGAGLIACSACLQGEVPYRYRHEGMDAALKTAKEYAAIFPGRFYLELMENGMDDQREANEGLVKLAAQTGLPLVATNDCHYLNEEDAEAHDVLLCIGTGKTVETKKRLRFGSDQFFYKSPERMEAEFSFCPQALENVERIVQACNVELELNVHHFPVYQVPEGRSLEEEFRDLVNQGLKARIKALPYEIDEEIYWKRLNFELDIICEKGFPAYFLIVQDFINWAKSKSIPVGPGRGSAAGSLVSYALRITDLDPIRYGLIFERFLNVERESLPDIDVDFCYNRRDEVIRYVTEKYGFDHVAQIIAVGTMKARGVLRDVGRALDIPLPTVDRVAKLVPTDLKMTLKKALEQEPELQKLADEDESIAELLDVSRRLEGLARHPSTHAAGIVISRKPMMEYVPLFKGKNDELITQFDMKKVEKSGLIKFDFLGLKTLTVIDETLKLIAGRGVAPPVLETIPLDDAKTYEMLGRGESEGVFQLESSGMRAVLKDLGPTCFEDVVALLALYRPGPLESGMVKDFVDRKHGRTRVEYPYPCLEKVLDPILKDTYGVILYQEQVMRIASDMANYSLGEADILRRAMGKKDEAVMAQQRSRFLQGARANGIPDEAADYIFDLVRKFAGYGFNKSHSAAYALISYQTAYLKAHYPVEFMAAIVTSEVNDSNKVMVHINACRDAGIEILPPDVNWSRYQFTVEDGKIRFGLAGIKGVGQGAAELLVAEREAGGPYQSLLDLCQRLDLKRVNKKVLECLIKSGSMDCLGCARAMLMAGLDRAQSAAQKTAKQKSMGQLSLMTFMPETKTCSMTGLGMDLDSEPDEYPEEERLRLEKESFGFFLFSHPLSPYRTDIDRLGLKRLADCLDLDNGTKVRVAVVVTGLKKIVSKKGERMAFAQIEDMTGAAEAVIFPSVFATCRQWLEQDVPLVIEGSLKRDQDQAEEGTSARTKVLAESFVSLTDVISSGTEPVDLEFSSEDLDACLDGLAGLLAAHPGSCPVRISVRDNDFHCRLQLGGRWCVGPEPSFWREYERLSGRPQ
ncbi:MAG: DNA polymerase III subunit alpha [Deltaproteobacteria bacterium]|nr:DNA polymerase III subunit alpha [Deltaproteobacteria bacterium]